jgi:hypothetical protein
VWRWWSRSPRWPLSFCCGGSAPRDHVAVGAHAGAAGARRGAAGGARHRLSCGAALRPAGGSPAVLYGCPSLLAGTRTSPWKAVGTWPASAVARRLTSILRRPVHAVAASYRTGRRPS